MHAVGDEHLRAVQHPRIAVTPRAGADRGDVGAGVGLGHRHRGHQLARDHPAQVAVALRLRAAVHEVRARHVGVHQHRHDEAAEGRARQRLLEHDGGERVGAGAAVLGRIGDAEQAEVAELADHLARDAALVLPALAVRLDLVGEEAGDRDAKLLVLGAVVDRRHRPDRSAAVQVKSVQRKLPKSWIEKMSASGPGRVVVVMAALLHSKDAELRLLDRRIEGGREPQCQNAAGVLRRDHAVVPQTGRGVVRVALAVVLLEDRLP